MTAANSGGRFEAFNGDFSAFINAVGDGFTRPGGNAVGGVGIEIGGQNNGGGGSLAYGTYHLNGGSYIANDLADPGSVRLSAANNINLNPLGRVNINGTPIAWRMSTIGTEILNGLSTVQTVIGFNSYINATIPGIYNIFLYTNNSDGQYMRINNIMVRNSSLDNIVPKPNNIFSATDDGQPSNPPLVPIATWIDSPSSNVITLQNTAGSVIFGMFAGAVDFTKTPPTANNWPYYKMYAYITYPTNPAVGRSWTCAIQQIA